MRLFSCKVKPTRHAHASWPSLVTIHNCSHLEFELHFFSFGQLFSSSPKIIRNVFSIYICEISPTFKNFTKISKNKIISFSPFKQSFWPSQICFWFTQIRELVMFLYTGQANWPISHWSGQLISSSFRLQSIIPSQSQVRYKVYKLMTLNDISHLTFSNKNPYQNAPSVSAFVFIFCTCSFCGFFNIVGRTFFIFAAITICEYC